MTINGQTLDTRFLGQINRVEMYSEQLAEVNHRIYKMSEASLPWRRGGMGCSGGQLFCDG